MKVFFPKVNREDVVKEVSRCITEFREKLGLESIILFGSYAKDKYTVASDIDLLIIFDDQKSGEDQVYKSLMRNIKLPRVELHMIPKRNLEAFRDSKWMKTIEREGIKIL
ncbi:MAG: nucleotidyltransferase domain-containing protein [Candidatus Bathyarchaeia archaeon]